jgi:hypothetical protein
MRTWTVHARPEDIPPEDARPEGAGAAGAAPRLRAPVLVPEGFAWGAFFFAGLWFLWHRMWLVLLLYLVLVVVLVAALALLVPPPAAPYAGLALQLLAGLHARDLLRWTLARRGWRLIHIVVAPDGDLALARLLAHRPELVRMAAAAPA